ncbi:MAG TPA: hypothetical protein VJC15_01520 [Candidatus Paceibacterota bacterium]
MRKIYIALLLLTVALSAAPVGVEAQTAAAQEDEPRPTEVGRELTEAQKLAQIAVQLQDIEQEVNRLTLLATKVVLERQAADLQRQLAAMMPSQEFVAAAPVAAQPAKSPATPDIQAGKEPVASPQAGGDAFAQQERDDSRASGFAAALGPLGNLGTPEVVALIILAFLAVFVLVRRMSDRRKSPLPQPSQTRLQSKVVAPQVSQTPQPSSQPQPSLLQEGRAELSEKVAWK